LRLFEIGNVFTRRHGGPRDSGEEKHLIIALTGDSRQVHWSGPAVRQDFFSLKGIIESMFSRLKMPLPAVAWETSQFLHPGISASIEQGGEKTGCLGRIDPALAHKLDLPEEIYLVEMCLEPLLSQAVKPLYKESSPFPGSRRDLSILVDQDIPCADLIKVIKEGSPIVAEVTVFDLYQGEHVPAGKKSLALSVLFQSRERTLRDKEIDKVFTGIFNSLVSRFGVQPR
ncbi:MAG: hypothetical protein U9N45_00380, partial [Gemmatimonadota bacterium]|nr:hypothetical protein [Gemmatimonadota bacterium]